MRRRRFYVHRIQAWLGALVLCYSLLFFILAYFAPYIPPALKLISPLSLEERAVAARQFLVLSQTFWPALFAICLGATVFSIYLTHRIAGPLYRLEESAKEVIRGNLTLRIRLRSSDQLQELRGLLNEGLTNLDQALSEIRARQATVRQALASVLDEPAAQLASRPDVLTNLEVARKESVRIEAVLSRFELSGGY